MMHKFQDPLVIFIKDHLKFQEFRNTFYPIPIVI